MSLAAAALLPVFALILVGWGLRHIGQPGANAWFGIEWLVYWLLFPALLFTTTAGADLPAGVARDMALALAASAGFSTPIGCQPNLLVYGPGGYRYLDFTRAGLPLNFLLLGITLVLVPLFWPF